MAILLYQTTDGRFADRAIEALVAAGIQCHRWGPTTPGDGSFRGRSGAVASIYIERDGDYCDANKVLIELGAARETPSRLPAVWILRVAILTLLVLVVGYAVVLIRRI